MTILAIAQACANRLQLTSPTTFIGSTDNNMIMLKSMIEVAINEIKDDFPWPELVREYTFTLATSTDSYAFPGDYDRRMNLSLWNRSQKWPLMGPIDAVEWQLYKSGLITTFPRQRFRVKGSGTSQFFIDPTPSSSENGQTCVYEYVSTNAVRPKTWIASTSWAGLRYSWYNGNYYDRGGVGAATTGTIAPTHTSGSVSDGSISWTYINTPYAFTYDSDEVILDNVMIQDGAIWRFKLERGLDFQDLKAQALDQIETTKTKLMGAGVLTVNNRMMGAPLIGFWSYPEGNFGI